MASLQRIVITSQGTTADFNSWCNLKPGQLPALQNIVNYFSSLEGGAQGSAAIAFNVGAVKASGTVTFTSTGPTNGQTCTLFGVTFTAVTSGATGNQFNISTTPATVAANLASAINAASSLSGIVTATSLLGVVTVSAVVPGKIGNGLVMANVNLANTTFSSLAAGADGTAYSLNFG